ncbi:MAG: hypothetical protein ACR2OA_06735 [Rubripirellula sp.]
MQQFRSHASSAFAMALFTLATATADEPVPEGLPAAIKNPAIPSILDVTILAYNNEGHGMIAINKIYKKGKSTRRNRWSPPTSIRGYGYAGSDKTAPLKTIIGGKRTRFLVLLDGDLLYSTYNNRFPIREGDQGTLEVGVGFNGSGGPWLALSEITKQIPGSASYERNYIQDAKLTKAEEQDVVDLAHRCGITTVARISAYYLRPSSTRGITVESVEKIDGREVSCDVLEIKYKKWWPSTVAPQPGDEQLGDFWAGKVRPRKQTILKVGKKEYRTRSITGLSINESEMILEKLLAGNFQLAHGDKNRLEQVNWAKPHGFYKHGETISASFSHKQEGEGFFDLQIQQLEPELTISEVMQSIP